MAGDIACTFEGCSRKFPSESNMKKHLWSSHKVRSNKKKGPKKAKGGGKFPVQIHFCYNCGVPMPKEISL